MNETKQVRLPQYDILKAFAIFLVIWQHALNLCGYGMDFLNTWPGKLITSVNMPLFMFMVGYFSESSIRKSWKQMISTKWVTLLRPMCLFCVVQLVINVIFDNRLIINDIYGGVKHLLLSFIKPYWFIYALMYSIGWLRVFNWLCRSRLALAGIVSYVVLMLIPRALPIPHFMYFQSMYIFFIVGLLFKQFNWGQLLVKKYVITILIALTGYVSTLFFIKKDTSFYFFLLIDNIDYIKSYLLTICSGICGIMLLYVGIMKIVPVNNEFWKWLAMVGQYTLSIYMMQGVLCEIATHIGMSLKSHILDFSISVIVFVALASLSIYLKSVPLAAKYILGKTKINN